MTKPVRFESVGWGFFCLVLVAAIPAGVYFVFQITNEQLTLGMRAGAGVTLAVFFAAVASWAVNSLLQYRVQRLDAAAAEEGKSHKKTKKRSGG